MTTLGMEMESHHEITVSKLSISTFGGRDHFGYHFTIVLPANAHERAGGENSIYEDVCRRFPAPDFKCSMERVEVVHVPVRS